MNGCHSSLFQDIVWSQPDVLDRTLERARQLNLRVHLLRTLSDVDTVGDWLRIKDRV